MYLTIHLNFKNHLLIHVFVNRFRYTDSVHVSGKTVDGRKCCSKAFGTRE